MNVENPLCGAPRVHGELLKLGFEVAQSSVAKYMVTPDATFAVKRLIPSTILPHVGPM
jgi:hypothetical protein